MPRVRQLLAYSGYDIHKISSLRSSGMVRGSVLDGNRRDMVEGEERLAVERSFVPMEFSSLRTGRVPVRAAARHCAHYAMGGARADLRCMHLVCRIYRRVDIEARRRRFPLGLH